MNGWVVKKNVDLGILYTKQAAEKGILEAAHNLGVIYLEDKYINYDAIKALS